MFSCSLVTMEISGTVPWQPYHEWQLLLVWVEQPRGEGGREREGGRVGGEKKGEGGRKRGKRGSVREHSY